MKGIIIIVIMIVGLSLSAIAENFKAPTRSTNKKIFTDTTTTHTYEIKDVKYDVYKSKKGAFYIWKTSKNTGKKYKYYLPKKIQVAIGREYNEDK